MRSKLMRVKRLAAVAAVFTLGLAAALPATVASASDGATLKIGVGHTDPDNQQFSDRIGSPISGGRVWSYTDFFTREVTVSSGTTLDFQTPPDEFHVVALASS